MSLNFYILFDYHVHLSEISIFVAFDINFVFDCTLRFLNITYDSDNFKRLFTTRHVR